MSGPPPFTDKPGAPSPDALADAFAWFAKTTEQLQSSHAELQELVRRLGNELQAKNEALEASLRERARAETFLATILEHLTNGVIVRTGDGRTLLTNPEAEGLLAHAAEDVLAEAERGADAEVRVPTADGRGKVLSVTTADVPASEGNDACTLHVLEDVTWRKTLEAKLERTGRLAAMGEMASTIAHEVRNPLGSIELFASMLVDDLGDRPDARRLAEQISDGVRRLTRVVSNLLHFTQSPRPRARRADLADVVLGARDCVVHLAELSDVRVETALPEGGAPADMDPDLVQQVVMNILVNAVESMEDGGGTLRIEIAEAPPVHGVGRAFGTSRRLWAARIQDTGKGMSDADRERVFDPFYTTKPDGTGLGLAISDRIISAHGGFIAVESAEGVGTTFTIYLPVAAEAWGDADVDREAA